MYKQSCHGYKMHCLALCLNSLQTGEEKRPAAKTIGL